MAFKRSDLKNWTVRRKIEVLPGSHFEVDIKVLSEEQGMAIFESGSDLETAKGFITNVHGYLNERGKPIGLDGFWKDVATLPPTIVHKLAVECANAQHDAALKN